MPCLVFLPMAVTYSASCLSPGPSVASSLHRRSLHPTHNNTHIQAMAHVRVCVCMCVMVVCVCVLRCVSASEYG